MAVRISHYYEMSSKGLDAEDKRLHRRDAVAISEVDYITIIVQGVKYRSRFATNLTIQVANAHNIESVRVCNGPFRVVPGAVER